MDWTQFLRLMFASLATSLVVSTGLVVVMNPYGNLPPVLFPQHVITDQQQRFQYPAIVRTRAFDSAIFGTSSIRLLDPGDLEPLGRFAALAMNDARAWEQYMLMKLFLRHTPRPRTIIIGIDSVWCASDADTDRVTRRTFPVWMFDDDPLNDWVHVLNYKGLEIAVRQVAARLGFAAPALPPNGFRVFTPSEGEYDLERARHHLYGLGSRHLPPPQVPPHLLTAAEKQQLRLPALSWLKEISEAAPPDTLLVFLFVPIHARVLPPAGTQSAAEYNECRARIIDIAAARRSRVIDFRFRSPLTENDQNFWDPLHYRVPIAKTIADAILAAAVRGDREAADGSWIVPARNP